MNIESIIIEIPNNGKPTTEYIETELEKHGINPLRWAVVEVNEKTYKISVADMKGEN